MKFTKMNGLGNDYVYINCIEENVKNPEELAIKMSNRNFGIGSDGLVLIMPSSIADFKMRIFNADGSEAQMCGNASRCIGKYLYEKNLTSNKNITLETLSGIKTIYLYIKDKIVEKIKVDMGEPQFSPKYIGLNNESNKFSKFIIDKEFNITCVSIGNPHGVIFINDLDNFNIKKYGPSLENNKVFKNRANIEFVEIIDKSSIKIRVWERGSNETLACGTGACASSVISIIEKNLSRNVKVKLLGGDLEIYWDENNNHIYMTGGAEFSFEGTWLK